LKETYGVQTSGKGKIYKKIANPIALHSSFEQYFYHRYDPLIRVMKELFLVCFFHKKKWLEKSLK